MSLEAFGDEGSGMNLDPLLNHGWECDADMVVWWHKGEPEDTYTVQEVYEIYRSNVEED